MYDYLKGIIKEITPTYIVLENNGIGYKIYAANPFQFSRYDKQEVTVYVYHAVREDSELLYGFIKQTERNLFEQLLKVSGIGPKSALAIMAVDDHQGLIEAVNNSDIKYLTNFPGVGKKTAQQIIIDLQGKLEDFILSQEELWDLSPTKAAKTTENIIITEANEALRALGYGEREITKVQKQLINKEITTTDEYLRQALKLIIS